MMAKSAVCREINDMSCCSRSHINFGDPQLPTYPSIVQSHLSSIQTYGPMGQMPGSFVLHLNSLQIDIHPHQDWYTSAYPIVFPLYIHIIFLLYSCYGANTFLFYSHQIQPLQGPQKDRKGKSVSISEQFLFYLFWGLLSLQKSPCSIG